MKKFIFSLLAVSLLSACATTSGGNSSSAFTGKSSKATTIDTTNELARLNLQLGVGYIRNGRLDIAEEKLMLAQQYDPNLPEVYNSLGVLQEEQGKLSSASTLYAKAIELDPSNAIALSNYSRIQCQGGAGGAHISDIARNAPTHIRAGLYTGAATCANTSTNKAAAMGFVDQALSNDNNYAPALWLKTQLLSEMGQDAEALKYLDAFHNAAGYNPQSVALGLETAKRAGDTNAIARYAALVQ